MENENINPWVNIWVHPRKTLRAILNSDPKKIIIWIALLSGILSGLAYILSLWAEFPQKPLFHGIVFIFAVLVVAALMNVVFLYFGGWLYKLTGSWLNGKGSFTDLKCAIGWSNYPFMTFSILNILYFLSLSLPWLQVILSLCMLVVMAWGFVIYISLINEAHQFTSWWKGILTFAIAVILLSVAFLILALLVPLLSPLFQ